MWIKVLPYFLKVGLNQAPLTLIKTSLKAWRVREKLKEGYGLKPSPPYSGSLLDVLLFTPPSDIVFLQPGHQSQDPTPACCQQQCFGTSRRNPAPQPPNSQAPLPSHHHHHPASSGVSSIHWQAWHYHAGLFHISLFRNSPFPNRVLASSLQNQRVHWNALFCFVFLK